MFDNLKKNCCQERLIAAGWLLLVLSFFLPAFSSGKGVIYGFQAAIIGCGYALQLIIIDIFVVDGLLTPVDGDNQSFASSGFEYVMWLLIYISVIIASLGNFLFLSMPFMLKKRWKNSNKDIYLSRILWLAVICSIVSGLYVVLGFQDLQIGYFVWVISFVLVAVGYRNSGTRKI